MTALKAATWLAGEVRNFASSAACAGYLVCTGTARKEPPQLPPPPGIEATSHLPLFAGPALASMTLSIHDGHATVANAPFLKPLFQASDQGAILAVRPEEMMPIAVSQAERTAGFESMISLLCWSK